ncbi:MAG: gliding motility-associated C-terminal domain-containing protein, partial [Bacteroidales bacterium]|nr:gliding motility-associated C-terminal domain-containing protein [Bacteroidales bacterium]
KTIKVYPYPAPILDYTPNFVDSEDPTVTFTDKSEGSTTTIWNFHNGDIFTQRSVTYEFTDLEKDSVKVSMYTANELGCSADMSVMLPISVFAVWFPNAFTPDKTENSVFKVSTTNDIRDYSLYIYNRDGLLVFSTNNVSEGWDGTYNGKKCEQGTYVYVSTYRRIETDKVVQQKGTILLLR